MRDRSLQTSGSRRLAILLIAVTLPPAATLVWLGSQLLIQDRALLTQRDVERRQAATDAVVHSLQLSVGDAERHLLAGPVPSGMVRLLFEEAGVWGQPADRVAWLPRASRDRPDDDVFAQAERLEFHGDLNGAAVAYQDIARRPAAGGETGAFLRLARVRRRHRRWDDALGAYQRLARADDAVIEGAPAALQARRATCALLAEAGRAADLAREAAQLERDLLDGRWAVDRATWELTVADLERWTGARPTPGVERQRFSIAADAIWNSGAEDLRSVIAVADSGPITVLHGVRQDGTRVALAIAPDVVRGWVGRATANNVAAMKH